MIQAHNRLLVDCEAAAVSLSCLPSTDGSDPIFCCYQSGMKAEEKGISNKDIQSYYTLKYVLKSGWSLLHEYKCCLWIAVNMQHFSLSFGVTPTPVTVEEF